MNQIFLTDREIKDNLFPFTLTRSAADLRVGILTIREKWEAYLGEMISLADDIETIPDGVTLLSANIVPSQEFTSSLFRDGIISDDPEWNSVKIVQYPWHIFQWNDWAIRQDFKLITRGRLSAPVPACVMASGKEQIFIEQGAKLSPCMINAENGPVYIGRNAELMEGVMIRGPVAICEGAVVKMGAKIYGATTVGPHSVVGGEIKNSVIFGYSNKAHEGYLGDSVIGEWCNLGAGTSNSNLKNNAGEVRMWNNVMKDMIPTGVNKCGLIMGDYSKAAINTSFNTGTIVGVCANIFGHGLTPKYIPSFTWGSDGLSRYEFEKALADLNNWMKMKGTSLSDQEKTRLKLIFDQK